VDDCNVYFPTSAGIAAVPIAGGAISTIAAVQGIVTGLVVDADSVYWSNASAGTVMKAAK
jgi:hypothetical protein